MQKQNKIKATLEKLKVAHFNRRGIAYGSGAIRLAEIKAHKLAKHPVAIPETPGPKTVYLSQGV